MVGNRWKGAEENGEGETAAKIEGSRGVGQIKREVELINRTDGENQRGNRRKT